MNPDLRHLRPRRDQLQRLKEDAAAWAVLASAAFVGCLAALAVWGWVRG